MNNKIEKLLLFILLQLILVVSANAMEKVSLQLKWKNQFQFAGYYMAKEKGFYKDVGLDVDILEYQDGVDIVKNVLSGKNNFGIAYPNIILEKSADKKLLLLYALYQSSPHVLVSLKSSNIKTVEDFKNKKIMINKIAIDTASIISMLISSGVNLDTLKIIPPSYDINSLIDGEVDISTAYRSNELYKLNKKNIPYNIWDPKDYGFDLYDDILFTSQKELKYHPKRVKDFTQASLKGAKYAFSHIDETVELILKKYNSLHKDKEALLYEAKVLKKLAYQNTDKLGKIDRYKIQRIYDLYNILGLIKHRNIDLDKLIYANSNVPVLTKQEIKYLKNKKYITMCIDPHWMPFEKIENGKHIGLSADYFKVFKKFIGTDIKLVPTKNWEESLKFAQERRCDILSLAMATPKREKYFNFTKPYLKVPLVVATKLDAPFITDFSMLKGKNIAIPTGYAFVEVIKNRYPQINIVEVKNIDEGLKKVTHNEVYGYLGTLASIGYAFQKKFTGELKIAGKFDTTWDLGIAVRDDDPMLLGILQKAVESVDTNTHQHILNNWLSIKYEQGVDYSLIWKTVMIFIVILLIILFFYMKLNTLKNKIDKQKNEIEILSLTDPMTKLYNRRYFSQISKNLLGLAKREKTKLSLMMIDIDNFKNINDTYGHKAGDDVLISLSSTLVKLSRKSDIVCRFGGEEFIILLPKTDAKGAFVIAQKIRQNIEKLNIETDDAKYINSTVSIGLSEIDTDKDKTIEPSIKRADDALYEAKRDGKNKVCIKNIGENICLQD